MTHVFKFEPIHERTLAAFGFTLLQAQSLPEEEKYKLHDRIQGCMSFTPDESLPEHALFDADGFVDGDTWEALDDLCSIIYWPLGCTEKVIDASEYPDDKTTSVPPNCVLEDGEWRPCFTCEVALATSETQASNERRDARAFWSSSSSTKNLYFDLDTIPDDKCIAKEIGWKKEICMTKDAAKQELIRLRPNDWQDWVAQFDKIDGDNVWLMGWGD